MDRGKPTLEGMPVEIQMEIMRPFLRGPYANMIVLYPLDCYRWDFGFGSLGILSVSKHFSAIALSVLYGENDFYIWGLERELEESDESKECGDEEGLLTHERLKSVRWSNLRNLPKDQLTTISAVDCLDLISQTQPGQERLKKLGIKLTHYVLMVFLEGSLLRILRRLRGLQSLQLQFDEAWGEFIPNKSLRIPDWPERFGRSFLLLIKNELGHIKAITLPANPWPADAAHISGWISHELEKRNEAWVPPAPAYMNLHRTPSSIFVLDPQIIRLLANAEMFYRRNRDKSRIPCLEDAYGVFP
ncbi:hypothetical protein HO133_002559 [Letharia lupina]|uniref:Uncharacterized protein n=1 Tax=Letharia lupina TaxID=560253 RepID=A0A8H6FAQ7_9LECA|nr:uncharacterized protein HO133_002559 [Letharia lupina]KAF6220879.1 hypothetical protein HO133_002559 [Letharia lupina]